MLRVIILAILIVLFLYASGSGLFSQASLLSKLKRIPIQITVFAVLALAVVNGFRGNPEVSPPQSSEVKPASDVAITSSIATPVMQEPLPSKDVAAACVEQALNE